MLVKLDNTELAQCTAAGLVRLMRKLNGHWSGHYYHDKML